MVEQRLIAAPVGAGPQFLRHLGLERRASQDAATEVHRREQDAAVLRFGQEVGLDLRMLERVRRDVART